MAENCNGMCPATHGLATKMTRQVLEPICNRYQTEIAESREGSLVRTIWRCLRCNGADLPPELEIIEKNGGIVAMGGCECCGQGGKTLQKNHGKNVCSTCAAIRGKVRSNPQMIYDILSEFGVLAPHLDTEEIESRHLRSMAELKDEYLQSLGAKDQIIGKLSDELHQLRCTIEAMPEGIEQSGAIMVAPDRRYYDLAGRMSMAILLKDVSKINLEDVRLLAGE